MSTTGSIFPSLNLIAQGTNENERIGRKVHIRSIMWRWLCTLDNDVLPGNTSVFPRLMVILDKQCNGAPSVASGNNGPMESANFQSFNNLENSHRYKILYDRFLSFSATSGSGTGAAGTQFGDAVRHGSFYHKCNIPIEFSSTAGVIGEIRSNNIFVLVFDGNGLCALDSKVRLRFTDG